MLKPLRLLAALLLAAFGRPLLTSYMQLRVAPALAWKAGDFSLGLGWRF